VGLLVDFIKDTVTVAEKSTIWATVVDPTTSLDSDTTTADRGPDL
jgi:hypothetical protein